MNLKPALLLALALVLAFAGATTLAQRAGPGASYADSQVQASPVITKAGPALSIKPAGAAASIVSLGEVISRVEAVHRHDKRLVVLGEIGPGGASEVRIIDWASGQVVDSFWAYDPAISPDRSLIAFVRFYPLHFMDGTESQYRLYRVEATPERNRSFYKGQLQEGRSSADVGQPLYPAASDKPPRNNIGVTDAEAHEHHAQLAWSGDSRQLAFLDAHHGKMKVVVVPVPEEGSRPRPMPSAPLEGLGKMCLPGADAEGCTVVPQEAVTLGFNPGGKTIKVQMTERTLFPAGYAKTLPLAAFKPAK